MEAEWVMSVRGKRMLVDSDNHVYGSDKKSKDGQREHLKCEFARKTAKGCKGRVTLEDGQVVSRTNNHNHSADPTRKEILAAKNEMKERAIFTKENTSQITPYYIQRLKQDCAKLGIQVEKIPQNVKFRLTARAQSCHSNSLHIIETSSLTILVDYEKKRAQKQAERRAKRNGTVKRSDEGHPPIKKLKIKIPTFQLGEVSSGEEDSDDSNSLLGSTRSVTPSSSCGGGEGFLAYSPRHFSPSLSVLSEPSPQGSPGSRFPFEPSSADIKPLLYIDPSKTFTINNASDWKAGKRSESRRSSRASLLMLNNNQASPRPSTPPGSPVQVPKEPAGLIDPKLLVQLSEESQSEAKKCKPCFVRLEKGETVRVMVSNATGTRGLCGVYHHQLFQTPESPCISCQICRKLFGVRKFLKHHHDHSISNGRLFMHVPGRPVRSNYSLWGGLLRKFREFNMQDLAWELPENLIEYSEQREAHRIPRPSAAQMRVAAQLCESVAKSKKATLGRSEDADSRASSPQGLEKAQRLEKSIRDSTAGVRMEPLEPVKPAQKQYRGDSFDMVHARLTLNPKGLLLDPSEFPFGHKDPERERSIQAFFGIKG